jgi:DNA-binding winged helix-turn-helix (wHTH) protein
MGKRVMKVLVELASHLNQLLSKEELIEAVWPNIFVGDDVLTPMYLSPAAGHG